MTVPKGFASTNHTKVITVINIPQQHLVTFVPFRIPPINLQL